MRKILLVVIALVLLGLVLGVSYIKALRADSDQDRLYHQAGQELSQQLKRQLDDSLSHHRRTLDSITQDVSRQQLDFLAVLNRAALKHRSDVDSLSAEVARRDSVIDSISVRVGSTQAPEQVNATSDKPAELSAAEKQQQREKAIIDHYQKRYQSLPRDLSAYERRVALGEVRSETASKFGLSLSELDTLLKKHDVIQ
jgi:uncharacterized membrane protein